MSKTSTIFRKHPWSLSRRLLNWKSQRSKKIPWNLWGERQKRDCFRLPFSVLTISLPETNPQTSSLLPLHFLPHLWVSLVSWLFESVGCCWHWICSPDLPPTPAWQTQLTPLSLQIDVQGAPPIYHGQNQTPSFHISQIHSPAILTPGNGHSILIAQTKVEGPVLDSWRLFLSIPTSTLSANAINLPSKYIHSQTTSQVPHFWERIFYTQRG